MTGPPLESSVAAFEQLYADTYLKVLAYARRRTESTAEADDVVAATFLVAWRRLDKVLGADHPLAWLYAVAYRVNLNRRRSAARASRLRKRVHGLAAPVQDITQITVEADETLSQALQALATLSPADQEILRLAAFEQLTHEEIAQVLGIRPSLVRGRLFRARQRLQVSFEQMEGR